MERCRRAGDTDRMGDARPGDILERRRHQHADIRRALRAVVRRVAKLATTPREMLSFRELEMRKPWRFVLRARHAGLPS
jgi:hypothetical protein